MSNGDPGFLKHIDWLVYTRDWGTWSEPCETIEEARELSDRTGGGPVYRRTWELSVED
ncbi:MAG: hypothetical protein GX859_04575 [Corynebacterium humireducens]|jgi:hypothetical protein|uniref:Uncharacterized protein n=1 Tax=Corynebacterium humireducens TaxID=1223514 RepID=A0A7X6SUW5_9CORY|nr:hypothetical protein [Corynebacterium humireducens]